MTRCKKKKKETLNADSVEFSSYKSSHAKNINHPVQEKERKKRNEVLIFAHRKRRDFSGVGWWQRNTGKEKGGRQLLATK